MKGPPRIKGSEEITVQTIAETYLSHDHRTSSWLDQLVDYNIDFQYSLLKELRRFNLLGLDLQHCGNVVYVQAAILAVGYEEVITLLTSCDWKFN